MGIWTTVFPQDTARPSTFQLDGPATPHIDARIADTHLHLHGMAWYGFAQFLIPAAISYSVSLDILRHHSPSSLSHFSSTLISPSPFVSSPLFSPLIHDFIRLTSPVPLFHRDPSSSLPIYLSTRTSLRHDILLYACS